MLDTRRRGIFAPFVLHGYIEYLIILLRMKRELDEL